MNLPARLLTPDLLLHRDFEDLPARPAGAAGANEIRAISVRSSGRHAGYLWLQDGISGIELVPEHRRRGRGTEAMSVWLEALQHSAGELAIPAAEHPAVRAFCRDFGLRRDGALWRGAPRTAERLADLRQARLRRYRLRVHMTLLELGVPGSYGEGFRLPLTAEAPALLSIGRDGYDREQYLAPDAATAWAALRAAAAEDGVTLEPVSAFRGFDDQLRIIQRKRSQGQRLSEIVTVSALPGYSEHHSGGALDLTTPGAEVLEESFAETNAYRWLQSHASRFGFHESYPRDNAHGIAFEPWHWCHGATATAAVAALA